MSLSDAGLIADLLGGKATLQANVREERDFVEIVRAGIPADALRTLTKKTQTSMATVGEIAGIDRSTLMRRLRSKGRLKPDESDRVLRFARTFALARHALGDDARAWLHRKSRALGGIKPIELLDTDSGARQVENVLGRIEHGVFS